jgi:hypothetical protein
LGSFKGYLIRQGGKNPGRLVAWEKEIYYWQHDCGSFLHTSMGQFTCRKHQIKSHDLRSLQNFGFSVWNFLQVTFLAPRIWRCFLNFRKVVDRHVPKTFKQQHCEDFRYNKLNPIKSPITLLRKFVAVLFCITRNT